MKGFQHHKCMAVVEPSTFPIAFKKTKLKRLQGLTQYVMYLHKLEKSEGKKIDNSLCYV